MNEENGMQLTKDTKLKDILAAYPWIIDDAAATDSRFRTLNSPLGRALIGRSNITDVAKRV